MSKLLLLPMILGAGWLLVGPAPAQTRPTEMRPAPAKPKPVSAKPAPVAKPASAKAKPVAPKPLAAKGKPQTKPTSRRRDTPANASETESVAPSIAARPRAPEIEMVLIRAGTFLMGSPETEENRSNDEEQHSVTLSRDFYLGKYEVTQSQWQAVMGNNPSQFIKCGGNCPVENVSWDRVQNFISRLNELSGLVYRLPTEAEWEYAARAGTIGPYAGNLDAIAWYKKSGTFTNPVGGKQPNNWGLYDMQGNVWELVNDGYSNFSAEAVTDPSGPGGDASLKVQRGGSWLFSADSCRSAGRGITPSNSTSPDLGFRLARTP